MFKRKNKNRQKHKGSLYKFWHQGRIRLKAFVLTREKEKEVLDNRFFKKKIPPSVFFFTFWKRVKKVLDFLLNGKVLSKQRSEEDMGIINCAQLGYNIMLRNTY